MTLWLCIGWILDLSRVSLRELRAYWQRLLRTQYDPRYHTTIMIYINPAKYWPGGTPFKTICHDGSVSDLAFLEEVKSWQLFLGVRYLCSPGSKIPQSITLINLAKLNSTRNTPLPIAAVKTRIMVSPNGECSSLDGPRWPKQNETHIKIGRLCLSMTDSLPQTKG